MWIEILVIVIICLYLIGMAIYFIRKKMRGESISECDCASKGKNLVKAYHKKYKKKGHKCGCSCSTNHSLINNNPNEKTSS